MAPVTTPVNFSGQYVEAIPGTPLPHGLLNVATIIDVTDKHELNGVEWQPLSCATAQTTFWCPPEGDPDPDPKTFTNSGRAYAPPVAVYYGRECPPVGGDDYDKAVAYVKAGLAIGEQPALERWVWQTILEPAATDVTPVAGTPVAIDVGIGLIEGNLGEDYGGVGVLHVPLKAAAAVASDGHLIQGPGPRLSTWVGNFVSLGAGYPNESPAGVAAPAGQAWLYASGPVIMRREGVVVVPPSDREAINIIHNDRDLLAERVWVVGVECAVEAVLVDLTK